MTEEEAFLSAIHAAPDDDVPRLVYSDWLEERGQPADVARAEFTRTQVQLAALAEDDLAVLLRARFAGRLKGLRLCHEEADPQGWRAFASPSLTGSLRRLDAESPLTWGSLRHLLALPGLRNLDSLKLSDVTGAGDSKVIPESSFWQNAVAFETHDVPFPEPSFRALCQRGGPPGLKKLDLMGASIGRGMRHLAAAPFTDALTHLGLGRCGLDDNDLAVFASAGRGDRLRSLDLRAQSSAGFGGLTDAGVLRLTAPPALARLRSLNLTCAKLTARAIDALLNNTPWRLAELQLGQCDLPPKAVAVLASSPALARLRTLDLSFNKALEGDALLPLAESPYLSPLCDLIGGAGERPNPAGAQGPARNPRPLLAPGEMKRLWLGRSPGRPRACAGRSAGFAASSPATQGPTSHADTFHDRLRVDGVLPAAPQ